MCMTERQKVAKEWRRKEAEAWAKVRTVKSKKAVCRWVQEAKDCAAFARANES